MAIVKTVNVTKMSLKLVSLYHYSKFEFQTIPIFFRSDSFTLDDVTKVDSSLPETILATEDDIEEETSIANKDKPEPDKVYSQGSYLSFFS